jgi:hypothetical protein
MQRHQSKTRIVVAIVALSIGCESVQPADDTSSLAAKAPTNSAGHWVLLDGDTRKSPSAIKAEVDGIFASSAFSNDRYWQGIQLRVNWVDVQATATANLDTSILDDFLADVAADNAAYGSSKKVNLQIQYKSFGATNTAVPSGVDAFEMNNPGWIAELWKPKTLGYFTGLIDKLAVWYGSSTNAKTLLRGIVFPETACGGCGAANGYTAPLFETAIEGYLREARTKFPSTLVIDQLTNFFVTASGDPHPGDDQWYLYDLATWACGNYVGIGGPDAPEYNPNKSTCGSDVPWSDPGSDVVIGKGKSAAYALNRYLHIQYSEQGADYQIPNTTVGDYSMMVDTLGSTEAVWLNKQTISGTCSNNGNSFDIDNVFSDTDLGPITNSPSWNCGAIPPNTW